MKVTERNYGCPILCNPRQTFEDTSQTLKHETCMAPPYPPELDIMNYLFIKKMQKKTQKIFPLRGTSFKVQVLGFKSQRGLVALILVFIILSVAITLSLSVIIVFLNRIQASRNLAYSDRAYYVAEAGIEDALLRIGKNLSWADPIVLTVGDATATTAIGPLIANSRAITAQGDVSSRRRDLAVTHTITTQGASFNFGVQVGNG